MPKRKRTPGLQAELSKDRCPNCGGPLKFPERWKEGLCTTCGIFVEILSATPEPGPARGTEVPEVKARLKSAKFYLESEDLLSDDEEGERESAAEETTDAPRAEGPDVTPEPSGPEAPAPEAAPEKSPAPAQPAPASPTAEATVTGPKALKAQTTKELPQEPPPPEAPTESALPVPPPPEPEPPAREPEVPEPGAHEVTEPEPTTPESAAPEAEAETIVEPEPEAEAESEIAIEPSMEPEPVYAAPEPVYEVVEPEPVVPAAASRAATASASRGVTRKPRLRDRVLLYVGAVQVAFGGAGLLLGSLVHDYFRVPLFGHAYDTFGQVNLSAVMFGSIFLAAGLAAIGLSLRGGVVNLRKAARA